MKIKFIPVTTCAALVVGLSLLGQASADDVVAGAALLPPGITVRDLNSDRPIEKAFKAVTEDAMNKTGFDNLVSRLTDQDRERITKSLTSGSLNNINGSKNQKFTDIVASIEGGWKLKYNQNFDIDVTKVFTPTYVHVQTGEVLDANQLVGRWPVRASMIASNAGALTPQDANNTKDKMFGGDVNLEKGRNVAVAQFQTSEYFSGLNASLIHEAGGWRFDIPNTVDAVKLYDNLVNNLTAFDKSRDQWSNDINESYRRLGQAVVAALYDAPYPGDVMRKAPGAAMNRP